MTAKREDYFKVIRDNEKEYAMLVQKNMELKQRFAAMSRELNELI
jgi:hypothetical protein